jgi:hypothetical protein
MVAICFAINPLFLLSGSSCTICELKKYSAIGAAN